MTFQIVKSDTFAEGLTASLKRDKATGMPTALDRLRRFAVTKEQVSSMTGTHMIWRNIVALSHLSIWAAPGNGGKTTIAKFAAGELAEQGYDVMFLQEDASAGDLPALYDHAEQHGYTLLNSTLSGASVDDQLRTLKDVVASGDDLKNLVLFFDTLKKYVDLMSKGSSREFFRLMRSLTQRGATVVLLGHTNKHRGPDGRLIFEGVGDVRNDVDELVYIESTARDSGGMVTMTMAPDKVRSLAKETTFRLDTNTMQVWALPEVIDVRAIARRQQQMKEDADLIEATRAILQNGGMPKFKLIERLVATGVGDRTARAIVNRYMGSDPVDKSALWIETYMRMNNTRHVSLPPPRS